MPSSPSPPSFRWSSRDRPAVAAIVIAVVGAYANSLPNDFVYDDRPICLEDKRTRDLRHWRELFTQSYWEGSAPGELDLGVDRLDPLYRPVTLLSFALNHAVGGARSWAYRAINLILHAGVSLAVYALAMQIAGRRRVATLAGLVFAVHPVHTEAVVPIVGRSELLAAITVTTALVLYLQDALRAPKGGMTWRYLLILLLFVIGVFSKESAITFCGLVVAADAWVRIKGFVPSDPASWSRYLVNRLVRRYLGVLAVAGAFLAARGLVVGHLFSNPDVIPPVLNVLVLASPWERVLTCLVVLAKYVYLQFLPYPLSYDYSSPVVELRNSLWSAPVCAGLLCVLLMGVAVIVSVRRRVEVAAAVIFFVITYSVASNLVFRIGVLMAERLIYLPSVGACLLCALAADAVGRRWPRPLLRVPGFRDRVGLGGVVLGVGVGLTLCAYGILTIRRNTVWRNTRVLFETGVRIQPHSHKTWLNLALLHYTHNEDQKALECLYEARRLAPNSYETLGRIAFHHATRGQREEALRFLEQASRYRWPSETFTLWMMAQLHHGAGRLDQAVRLYEEVLRHRPRHEVALVNLTGIYADPDSGRFYDLNKAYECARKAADLPAPQPQSLVALADVCVKMNRRDEALRVIGRGFRLLTAYRERARELGRLQQEEPNYDRLEASLREMLVELDRAATRPSTTRAAVF